MIRVLIIPGGCAIKMKTIDLHVEVVVDGQEGPIYDDGDCEVIKPTQITS